MSLPIQKVSLRNKTKQWGKDTVDHFDRLTLSTTAGNRNSNYIKKINYDLFNGVFNKADLEYVCNPLGLDNAEFPATLQHYDVTTPALNLLIGEESKRADNNIVISESPLDINRKQTALKQRIVELLQQKLMEEIDPSTVDPNQPLPTPEEVLKYERHNISDMIESKANKLLKHLKKYLSTKEVFKKGWKDALLVGEEIYWTGIANGEVLFRRCNPLNTTVVLDGDTDYIDDALAVMEVRMLSISSILDEFGDELTPADISRLEQISRRFDGGTMNGVNDPSFSVDRQGGVVYSGGAGFTNTATTGGINSDLIRVVRVEWKSLKKLYYLTYTDEMGEAQDLVVDETMNIDIFKQSFPDAVIEEFWIPEAWEGIKIGDEIYVMIQAKPNQRRRMDNPYYCKLGYVGLIYSATNSVSVSLLDRIKPYQYLYNIFMYRLELTYAQDQGKKFIMDLAQIPRSEGIDIERWMYYFKAMGIGFINSFEEGRKGGQIGKTSTFNQFKEVDLSMANTIQQYINTLDYIKNQIAFISGVTPQRLGAIETRELVGNVERSVQQSALVTECMFDSHDEVKRRVYTALIECAKVAYKDGKKIQYILDDMGIELLDLEEMELENSEFNVFISNANKDHQVVESLKQLAQVALQHDKADLSTIIDTIINDNPRDIVRILQRAEAEKQAQLKAQQDQLNAIEQQKVQAQQQAVEAQMQDKQADRDLKQYEIDTNNETKIMVAEISALSGKDGPSDMDGDGIPDPIEVAKVSLMQRDLDSKAFLEQQKIKSERDKKEKELSVKEREIKMKEDVENKKIKAIEVQNRSQEKMQNVQMENERKQLAMQAQIEKDRLKAEKEMHAADLKVKREELEIKKKDLKNKIELEKIKLEAAKQKAKADKEKSRIDIQKKRASANKPSTPKKPKK